MFGLLSNRPLQTAQKQAFRQNYCGTCKAIGTIYGHKERLLLNYDVVFLSELLSGLRNRDADFAAISVNKCFQLPRHTAEIPVSLAYAASINLLLASIKIRDNIQDSRYTGFFWRGLALLQRQPFGKALQKLEQWGLSGDFVNACAAEQVRREKQGNTFMPLPETCACYTEMTGLLTGAIFRQGAIAAGKPEAADDMQEIGNHFGQMVYLIDALQDYEADKKKGSFNPFLTLAQTPAASLPDEVRDAVFSILATHMLMLKRHLNQLPVSQDKIQAFSARLDTGLSGAALKHAACNSSTACRDTGLSLTEKYRIWQARLKNMLVKDNAGIPGKSGAWLLAGIIAPLLLFVPLQVLASAPADQNVCCRDTVDCCCSCICDACTEELCNSDKG